VIYHGLGPSSEVIVLHLTFYIKDEQVLQG
jgi:hypothetical protein